MKSYSRGSILRSNELKLPIQNLEEPFIHLVLPTNFAEEPRNLDELILEYPPWRGTEGKRALRNSKKRQRLERAKYVLRLYVTGMTPKSTQAIANVQKLCEQHLAGRYELKVIDIYQQPQLAKGDQIIATPTLIKKLPLPLRKLIGDMSDTERFLVGIDLKPKNASV